MPIPEPEIAKVATDGLVWKAVTGLGTAALGVFSFLFSRVIKKHDDEIASIKAGIGAVSDKLDDKADSAELNRQRDHISRLFEQAREDKTEILSAIGKVAESLGTFKETVLTELGNRPTRAEMTMNQGPKRRGYDRGD